MENAQSNQVQLLKSCSPHSRWNCAACLLSVFRKRKFMRRFAKWVRFAQVTNFTSSWQHFHDGGGNCSRMTALHGPLTPHRVSTQSPIQIVSRPTRHELRRTVQKTWVAGPTTTAPVDFRTVGSTEIIISSQQIRA